MRSASTGGSGELGSVSSTKAWKLSGRTLTTQDGLWIPQ